MLIKKSNYPPTAAWPYTNKNFSPQMNADKRGCEKLNKTSLSVVD